jgi:hypothetical protein
LNDAFQKVPDPSVSIAEKRMSWLMMRNLDSKQQSQKAEGKLATLGEIAHQLAIEIEL